MQFSGRSRRLLGAVAAAAALSHQAHAEDASEGVNPIEKVLQMLADLEQKTIKDGEKAQKVYDAAAESCEDRSRELHHEVKVAKAQSENLEAVIEKNTDDVDSLSTKIEELSSTISADEKDLKAATDLRNSEKSNFDAAEAELKSTIDTLERAIGILEKDGGAALLQTSDGFSGTSTATALAGADKFAQTLSVMVEASGLSAADSGRLTALLQATDTDSEDDSLDDEDEAMSAPDGAAYEGKSGEGSPLVKTMEGLLEKSQTQLQEVREQEVTRQNNYNMLKQSLSTKIQYANSDLSEAKGAKGEAAEKQATAEGALSVTKKDLAEDLKALSELHRDCMTRAADFEEETRSRGEELKALAQAKKVIAETTGGAEDEAYASASASASAAASFVQMAMKRHASANGAASTEFDVEAVKIVRQLAFKKKNVGLAQLAERMENTVREGDALGDDVFGKVKGMLTDMVEKLQQEAEEDAQHQSFCTKEMDETNENKADKSGEVEKLTTKIDTMSSQVTKLQKEVSTTNAELAKLAQWQGEMNSIRGDEKAIYDKKSADMKKGIKGLQLALKVLRDYYSKSDDAGHDADEGTGGSIIGLLEVCESDFTKSLSEIEAEEETALEAYEKETQENEILKAEKTADATYKTKESKALSKAIAEFSSDRDGAQTELDAVNEYLAKLKEQCIAKPEPYEARKKRREKEMQGLQDAMKKLSGEAVFLQLASTRHSLRGLKRH